MTEESEDSQMLDWLGQNGLLKLFFDRSDPRESGSWVVEAPTGTFELPGRSFIGIGNSPRDAIRAAMRWKAAQGKGE